MIVTTGYDALTKDARSSLEFLELPTSISNGDDTRVAMTNPNGRLLVTGPSVRLPLKKDLKGVIQNFVSLFNNAPRSAASGKFIGSNLRFGGEEPLVEKEKAGLIVKSARLNRYSVEVEGLDLFNDRDFTKSPYFGRITNFDLGVFTKSVIEIAVSKFKIEGIEKGILDLTLIRTEKGFDLVTEGFESPELIAMLAANRDFFTPFLSIISKKDDALKISMVINQNKLQPRSIRTTVAGSDSRLLEVENSNLSAFLNRVPTYIRKLFNEQSSVSEAQSSASKESRLRKTRYDQLDLTNPNTYTDNAIFIEIPATRFRMGKPGMKVETIITKPYKLMATPFTQKFYRKLQSHLASLSLILLKLSGTNTLSID